MFVFLLTVASELSIYLFIFVDTKPSYLLDLAKRGKVSFNLFFTFNIPII